MREYPVAPIADRPHRGVVVTRQVGEFWWREFIELQRLHVWNERAHWWSRKTVERRHWKAIDSRRFIPQERPAGLTVDEYVRAEITTMHREAVALDAFWSSTPNPTGA